MGVKEFFIGEGGRKEGFKDNQEIRTHEIGMLPNNSTFLISYGI